VTSRPFSELDAILYVCPARSMEAAWVYALGYLLLTVASWWLIFRPSSSMTEQQQQRSVEGALKAAPSSSDSKSTSTVVLSVNGVVHRVENPAPGVTLLTYLREHLGLTGDGSESSRVVYGRLLYNPAHLISGAKIGCGEGGCGACTVLLEDEARSVNSCLRLLAALDGAVIRTVEGIGS
jgi:aerobic-type carbon monoxide dehydrogenase small subunit (CoxS/CutS family)